MSPLTDWARQWGVSTAALADLQQRLGGMSPAGPQVPDMSEAGVQSRVRLAAARLGWHLWRNNVGAGHIDGGQFVRWGLANDSQGLNAVCKSADLVGVRPLQVTPAHVGTVIGQFVSLECKHSTWRWANTDRERAQRNWANVINAAGGYARFVTSEVLPE